MMQHNRTHLNCPMAAAVAGAAILTSLVLAPPTHAAPPGTSATSTIAVADKQFATKAAQGGVSEVVLGKLAEMNALSPAVKAFGRKMVADHVRANKDLDKTASAIGLSLQWTPEPSDRALLAKLSRLRGAPFDKAYKSSAVSDHEQDIATFQREAANGKTDALREFAQRTLPILQVHLQMARNLASGKTAYAHRTMGGK